MTFRQLCFGITATVSIFHACYGSTTIPFPFELGKIYYNPQTRALFVGANTIPGPDHETMSVSYIDATGTTFTGITPERVTLNDVGDQPNPLYNTAIAQLSFTQKMPLVVSQAQPNVLNAIKYYTSPTSMSLYTSPPVLDANGATSQGIIALGGTPVDILFAYVALPATGNFGDSGSLLGYAGLLPIPDPADPKKTKLTFVNQVTSRIEKSTAAIKVGSDLFSIGPSATIHPSQSVIPFSDEDALQNFPGSIYTGISAVGGSNPNDGVRGVIVNIGGTITPDTALQTNSIIGGIGANTEVHINYLSSLYTSTQLRYLVVAGGIGTAANTARTVYALPTTLVGTLAKKNALPVNVYNPSGNLWYRYFAEVAINAGDLYSPDSDDIYKARVGGTATLPGDIASLFTSKDSVFVTINTNNAPHMGGVFCSQALFSTNGSIQGWTNWRRVGGLVTPTTGGAIDDITGNVWAAVYDNAHILNTIARTGWSTNGEFVSSVTNLFADQKPGIQGLIDFPYTHPAFSQTPTEQISLLVATGYNRVALVQSGAYAALTGYLTPSGALINTHTSTDGSIGVFGANTDSIVVSGGVLAGMGGIITADIVSDSNYSWLAVGGNGGCALLFRPDGSGWPVGSLGKNFSNLPTDAAFKIVGNFRDVRKIIADGANLYIVTETECRRFTASQAAIAAATAGQPIGTLLASQDSLSFMGGASVTLSDLVVSGPVALISTSRGLIRVGNGQSVALGDYTTLNWQIISLPESVGPVTRFYTISSTGMQNQWATEAAGGNIYVLNGEVGRARSRVYRLAITGLTTTVTDNTITLFADHFKQNVNPSFYVSRGDYRNYMAYDGTLFYFMRSHFYPYSPTDGPAQLEAMGPALRAGVAFVEQNATRLIAATGLSMGPLVHRSAAGTMITGGSTMYANE